MQQHKRCVLLALILVLALARILFSALSIRKTIEPQFLFDKNALDFKPTTKFIEENCDLSPAKPIKKIESFRNYAFYKNLSELQTTNGHYETALAVCEFHETMPHFPHVMQELYKCYTYWQDNPGRIPILHPYDKNIVVDLFQDNPFVNGFLESILSQMNVEILDGDEIQEWLKTNMTKTNHNSTFFKGNSTTVNGGKDNTDGTVSKVDFQSVEMNSTSGFVVSHVDKLNELVDHHFAIDREMSEKSANSNPTSCPSPRIGILNRKRTRSILNPEHLVDEIIGADIGGNQSQFSTISLSSQQSVSVQYFEGEDFEAQVRFFHGIDLLISPHGAQLTGVPFMANKHCTHLIEFFPHNYLIPYYFGTLARDSGIEYSYVYFSQSSDEEILSASEAPSFTAYVNRSSDGDNMLASESSNMLQRVIATELDERRQARRKNFCVDPTIIIDAIREFIPKWCACKEKHDDHLL